VRIISGELGGRRLQAPSNLPVRPTTDRAKEGLFNVLSNCFSFEDVFVLDLFSGTGNISYEFASRGSKNIISVDRNSKCTGFIKKTIKELKIECIQVVNNDVIRYLNEELPVFDLIFADPPYNMEDKKRIVELVFSNGLLSEEGWFVLEHSKNEDFSKLDNYWACKKYGEVNFSIFKL